MNPRLYLDVDPRTLYVPTSFLSGADPFKLQRQIALHGHSTKGMQPLLVDRGADSGLVISDGVTRATRVAKFLSGTLIRVEVMEDIPGNVRHLPTIGDFIP